MCLCSFRVGIEMIECDAVEFVSLNPHQEEGQYILGCNVSLATVCLVDQDSTTGQLMNTICNVV